MNQKRQVDGPEDLPELDFEPARRAARRKQTSDTIAFRLHPDLFALLSERAAFQGMSFHQYARALVIEALLRDASERNVSSFLEKLHGSTETLRDDLIFCMKAIHMTIGRMSAAEADEWVRKNFKR